MSAADEVCPICGEDLLPILILYPGRYSVSCAGTCRIWGRGSGEAEARCDFYVQAVAYALAGGRQNADGT